MILIREGPKSSDCSIKYSYKERTDTEKYAQGQRPCDNRGRDLSDTITGHGTAKMTGSCRGQENISSLEPSEKAGLFSTSSLQKCERISFGFLKPPSL